MAELPDGAKKLLEEPQLAHVVTLMKDGAPQVSPVWVDHDGTHILINTAEGRQKPVNLQRDPRVAVSVVDKDNPFRYLLVRGKVVEVTRDGAVDHINKLSAKYLGNPEYPGPKEDVRIIVKILPEHVSVRGTD